MAVAQNTYTTAFAVGVPGMIADTELLNVISRTVESAAGITFGQPAYRGSGDHGVIVGGTFTATGAGSAAAGNTGVQTITAAPPVAAGAKAGRYVLTAVSAGATAEFLFSDPDGIELGNVTTGTPATIGGIGPFTITDAGTDPAIGDQMYIDVTFTADADFIGIAVINPGQPAVATSPDSYKQYDTASLLTKGVVWVTAGASVADGGDVYWNPATLRYTSTTTHVRIPGYKFDTSGSNAGLVRITNR